MIQIKIGTQVVGVDVDKRELYLPGPMSYDSLKLVVDTIDKIRDAGYTVKPLEPEPQSVIRFGDVPINHWFSHHLVIYKKIGERHGRSHANKIKVDFSLDHPAVYLGAEEPGAPEEPVPANEGRPFRPWMETRRFEELKSGSWFRLKDDQDRIYLKSATEHKGATGYKLDGFPFCVTGMAADQIVEYLGTNPKMVFDPHRQMPSYIIQGTRLKELRPGQWFFDAKDKQVGRKLSGNLCQLYNLDGSSKAEAAQATDDRTIMELGSNAALAWNYVLREPEAALRELKSFNEIKVGHWFTAVDRVWLRLSDESDDIRTYDLTGQWIGDHRWGDGKARLRDLGTEPWAAFAAVAPQTTAGCDVTISGKTIDGIKIGHWFTDGELVYLRVSGPVSVPEPVNCRAYHRDGTWKEDTLYRGGAANLTDLGTDPVRAWNQVRVPKPSRVADFGELPLRYWFQVSGDQNTYLKTAEREAVPYHQDGTIEYPVGFELARAVRNLGNNPKAVWRS